ncbi:MAG: hypothetical protein Q7T55_16260 [Solirubrobacteraceae bacterium]|nr:hypothetical protein [Solirubrobacteraceae bacterium]
MPASVKINAASTAGAGGALIDAAGAMSGGGSKALAALADQGGLPPAFQGRATNLMERIPASKLASDCFATNGMELRKRAQLAIGYDSAGKPLFGASLGGLKGARRAAVSVKWTYWNKKTAQAAAKKPGGYYAEINKMINPLKAAKKSTAGKFTTTADLKLTVGKLPTEGSSKLSPTMKNILKRQHADGTKMKISLADLRKLTSKDLSFMVKAGVSLAGKVEASLDLGKGQSAKVSASLSLGVSTGVGYKRDDKGKRSHFSKPSASLTAKIEASVGSKAFTAFIKAEIKKELEFSKEGLKKFVEPKSLKQMAQDGRPTVGVRSDNWGALAKKIFESKPPPPKYTPEMRMGPDFVNRPTLTVSPGKG